MRHPFITAQLLRQARTAPLPCCQPAVSDRVQARANQEGIALTARWDADRVSQDQGDTMSRLTRGLVFGRAIGPPIRRRPSRAPRWD
jgi:predicted transcriptional regulator